VKIALLRHPVPDSDDCVRRGAQAFRDSAFNLVHRPLRVDDLAAIDRAGDPVRPDRTLLHGHFSDHGYPGALVVTGVQRDNTSGIRADYYFTGPYAQDFEFTDTALINKDLPEFSLLSGFDFRFNQGDHHIRTVAVDPISWDQYNVTFTDDERDNPVSGWIEYVNVHE